MINLIIGIAGKMGSGKTSLAKKLALLANGNLISFGAFIKKEAKTYNISPLRKNLQNFGERLIETLGYELFVKKSLNLDNFNSDLLIIDGIRHLGVWKEILNYSNNCYLIFLDIPEKIRIKRLINRENLNRDEILGQMNHKMEINIKNLKNFAQITFQEESINFYVKEIENKIFNKM